MDTSDFKYLRNPLVVITALGLLIFPEFLASCGFNIAGTQVTAFKDCPNRLVSEILVDTSVLSMMMVVVTFESFQALKIPFGLARVPKDRREWVLYQVKLFPIIVVGFLVYKALELLVVLPGVEALEWAAVFSNNVSRFFSIAFLCYLFVNIQPTLRSWKLNRNPYREGINGMDDTGSVRLRLDQIDYVEKKGRNYYARSGEYSVRINENLTILEKHFKKVGFVRINRSVLVRTSLIKSFSFWENEKYVLQIKGNREFIVTRKRLNNVKKEIDLLRNSN
ncbi:MAG: LytTR family DNA-binding domain-containing protein [Cyclobacteriaceae bacterium]